MAITFEGYERRIDKINSERAKYGMKDLEEARKIINRIRLRAKNSPYVKDFKHPEQNAANYLIGEYPAEGWNQDFARKALRWERRMEFAMEGDRRWDLIRWGIYLQAMNALGGTDVCGNVKSRSEKHLLFPIPTLEVLTNQAISSNNPGWS